MKCRWISRGMGRGGALERKEVGSGRKSEGKGDMLAEEVGAQERQK